MSSSVFQKDCDISVVKGDNYYFARVLENRDNQEVVITAPYNEGVQLRMTEGAERTFELYSGDSIYTFDSEVLRVESIEDEERYVIKYPKKAKKRKRRAFFRLEKCVDVKYIITKEGDESGITVDDDVKTEDDSLPVLVEENDAFDRADEDDFKKGITIDMSGGGILLACSEYIPAESELQMQINFDIPDLKTVKLKGKAVKCFTYPTRSERFRYRVGISFTDIDEPTRDLIIKYIFDEMRKMKRQRD